MRDLIAIKYSVQFIWDENNLQLSESYCSRKYFAINTSEKDNEGTKTLSHRLRDNQEIVFLILKSLNKQSKIPTYSITLNFSNIMDLQQQRLLAQILQQPEQKMLELKRYQTTLEHLQQQQNIQNPEITVDNFWRVSYPSLLQNLNSAISSVDTCSTSQISSAFNSVMNTNYLPAISSFTLPLLNIPATEKAQTDELTNSLIKYEVLKRADSAKQSWQNLMRHQKIQLPQLKIQHGLHQQMQIPSVSSFMKRRISESPQQQPLDNAQMTAIKRAKVTVTEQKNQESIPSCSFNDCNRISILERVNEKQEKIKKFGSNVCGKRKGKILKCDGTNAIGNQSYNNETEDNEDVQYVDVESLDEKLDAKKQKKDLIEFYRKVKSIRMSYAIEDLLICQMCEQKVQNSDSLILIHLYGHAEVMPYRCKMCGATECQLERMYAHIKQGHPNKDPSITYETRRNMAQIISLLRTCFPRNIIKTKTAYSDLIDKICQVVKEKSLAKLTCAVCSRKISTRKKLLMRHAQIHLHYRCKDCGTTLFGETSIIGHGRKKHGIENPQCTIHFDECVNTSDKREIALKNCFGNIVG